MYKFNRHIERIVFFTWFLQVFKVAKNIQKTEENYKYEMYVGIAFSLMFPLVYGVLLYSVCVRLRTIETYGGNANYDGAWF